MHDCTIGCSGTTGIEWGGLSYWHSRQHLQLPLTSLFIPSQWYRSLILRSILSRDRCPPVGSSWNPAKNFWLKYSRHDDLLLNAPFIVNTENKNLIIEIKLIHSTQQLTISWTYFTWRIEIFTRSKTFDNWHQVRIWSLFVAYFNDWFVVSKKHCICRNSRQSICDPIGRSRAMDYLVVVLLLFKNSTSNSWSRFAQHLKPLKRPVVSTHRECWTIDLAMELVSNCPNDGEAFSSHYCSRFLAFRQCSQSKSDWILYSVRIDLWNYCTESVIRRIRIDYQLCMTCRVS